MPCLNLITRIIYLLRNTERKTHSYVVVSIPLLLRSSYRVDNFALYSLEFRVTASALLAYVNFFISSGLCVFLYEI